jgi:hypothetical protein
MLAAILSHAADQSGLKADCGRIAPAYVFHHHRAAETASRTFRECGLSADWERREAIELSPLGRMAARDGVEPPTPAFSENVHNHQQLTSAREAANYL